MSAAKTIPPDRLFWGLLTLPAGALSARAGSAVTRQTADLDAAFAEFLPVPMETVKPAYVALNATRVLAVAAQREGLTALIDRETTSVTPEALPEHLRGDALAGVARTEALNLLWGDLEAVPVVRARRSATLVAATVIVLLTAAAVLGLERRTGALRAAAAGERTKTDAVLTELYRKPTREAGAAALDRELARLVRTRAPRAALPPDAADALQTLLNAWPRQANAASPAKLRTESLTATPEALTLSVAVDERAQAESLSAALRAIPAWKLVQPNFSAGPAVTGAGGTGGVSVAGGGVLSLRLGADLTAAAGAGVPGTPPNSTVSGGTP